ncbi:hypothetical protein N568_0108755 [Lactococcus garvieae TRF1]|uniref:Arsenate reductase n=1 Tax=Lactococcus garvieae TRF1 TaxID=1380772 RepID=V8ANR3_9LACT|nr:hypothetical protein N568_0108755 [Lactococcus garvieae TRF1]
MIKIYFRGGCHSSQRALAWFEKYNLEIQKRQVNRISRDDLLKLLQLSDEGLKDITKRPVKSSAKIKRALDYMETLSFNEALDYILAHPYILQTPIIIKDNNLLIGYSEDEIRRFLPREYRRHQLKTE